MNNIFFQFPENTNRVALTVSDLSVQELKDKGVIPQSSKAVVVPAKENPSARELGMTIHVDKLRFNASFTAVDFDLELLAVWFLDQFRQIRDQAFKILDTYELRAVIEKREDILDSIQADKQALRDIPESIDYASCTTPEQVANKIPFALAVDYDTKYKDLFKG